MIELFSGGSEESEEEDEAADMDAIMKEAKDLNLKPPKGMTDGGL